MRYQYLSVSGHHFLLKYLSLNTLNILLLKNYKTKNKQKVYILTSDCFFIKKVPKISIILLKYPNINKRAICPSRWLTRVYENDNLCQEQFLKFSYCKYKCKILIEVHQRMLHTKYLALDQPVKNQCLTKIFLSLYKIM